MLGTPSNWKATQLPINCGVPWSANSDTKAKSVYVCHMGTGSRIPSRCLHWRMQVPHIKWYRVCI